MIVHLCIVTFSIVNFCFVYFEAVLLGAYKFRILTLLIGKKTL